LELHGKAILRPDSKISEYFVTVIVVSTAGMNSKRVSSLWTPPQYRLLASAAPAFLQP
jgi:hypothetical protein